MASNTESGDGGARGYWRLVTWGGAAALLALPAVAMRFTDEVRWSGMDFVVMAVLLSAVCAGFELAVRVSRDLAYRAGFGLALLTGFLLVWTNLAVGIIGDGSDRANLLFAGVLLIGLVGAGLSRFRARGMARTLSVTAAAQAAIGVVAAFGGWDLAVVILPLLFAGAWWTSAWLFNTAAERATFRN